jgi:hypothetical protein
MTAFLEYHLVNRYIHNWLVVSPLVLPVENGISGLNHDDAGLQRIYESLPGENRNPMLDLQTQPQEMTETEVGGSRLTWRYRRCMDDHLVDLSETIPQWSYLSAWAYSMLNLPAAQKATFVLTTTGPADVWLNGVHVHQHDVFHVQEPVRQPIDVELSEGENHVFVRFESVGVGECPFTMALEVSGLANEIDREVKVMVPTQAKYPRRHEIVEAAFEKAYLDEVVNHRGAHFNLRWAEDTSQKIRFAYQIQDKDGFSYVEGNSEIDNTKAIDVGHTFRIKERQLFVVLRPILLEYFDHNLRYEKKFPIYVTDNTYTSNPTGTFADRNREALQDATKHNNNLYAEIAKLSLGRWSEFKPDLVMETIQRVNRREVDSEVHLLGLLGIIYRYMNDPHFPERLKRPLQDCVLNFKYWQDEGTDINRTNDGLSYEAESQSILFHVCETLAGQLYPRRTFSNSGEKGTWQRKKGERLALEWLHQRGTQGFQDWDSNDTFEKNLLALSHLTSLTQDDTLRDLAAVMMDKTFFSMAVNSFKGSFGSSHGQTSATMLKSAQLEATSGISRMMWGTGVYNSHILGTVALATSNYEFPLLIGDIANDVSSKVLNRERHVVDSQNGIDVNKVTYRTADYMLCSAQDYRPGEPGTNEHIWQATMGSDAVVFVNHPACISESEAHRPGFWLGNRSLPRVAQWKDVLVALHRLPEIDWLGFTHAYFPIYMFSEFEIKSHPSTGGTWAFARKDNGYLALYASQGFELIRHAPDGYRELRSYGRNNIWLCQMGRAETDGNFEKFKRHILALKLDCQGLDVHCKTLRGEYLSFGWEAPLRINGNNQPIHGFKHHDSLYCVADLPATQMDIQSKGTLMRLDFS